MTTITTTHSLIESGFASASEPGALDHGYAVCACGFRTGNSLGERWAVKQLIEHAAYMNSRKQARR